MAHRLAVFVALLVFTFVALVSARAAAHDVPTVPPNVTSAVVRVDAYEHESLGVAIGDGRLVLVPFDAIEVARPGFPHAFVTDASGTRHAAGLAATDRASGLALLAVERPLTDSPLGVSPHSLSDAIDTFAITGDSASGALDPSAWAFYPAGTLAGTESHASGASGPGHCHPCVSTWPPRPGSPILDTEGRLVGLRSADAFFQTSRAVSAEVLQRLDGTHRERRNVIFYGGVGFPMTLAPTGGFWIGLGASFGARVRDVLDLRLDTEFAALVGVKNPPDSCSGSCYAGIRGVATPSVGVRWVLGGFGGTRAWPIALTPSLGLALGAQDTSRERGAPAYDAATPSTWAQLAPGLTLSLWAAEIRGRVRVPLDDTRAPSVELSAGIYF